MSGREPDFIEQIGSLMRMGKRTEGETVSPLPIEAQPWRSQIRDGTGGTQHVYRFSNGYGASVVQGGHTYGGDDGLWELGVVVFDGDDWHLTYDTPITDDVIGWLDPEGVAGLLIRIAALDGAS